MSKQVEKQLERFNTIIANNIAQNTKELTQLLNDLLDSRENFIFKLQEKCHRCSSFNIDEYYVRLDGCNHCLDSKCLIEQYLKPTHYRLNEEVMLRMNNVKCPVGNCNTIINIKKPLSVQEFKRKLLEKRQEYEDENSFFCHVMLEKVDNSYKLELPCGAVINKEMFIFDLFSKLSSFEEIKCHICNQIIDLHFIKSDLLEMMNEGDKKNFIKIYEKYYEKEVLKAVNQENSHYMYCPFPNCNQFLSFESGHTHHMIKYCDYCCEPLCFECKQSSKDCLYYDDIQRGKIKHKQCIINKH